MGIEYTLNHYVTCECSHFATATIINYPGVCVFFSNSMIFEPLLGSGISNLMIPDISRGHHHHGGKCGGTYWDAFVISVPCSLETP